MWSYCLLIIEFLTDSLVKTSELCVHSRAWSTLLTLLKVHLYVDQSLISNQWGSTHLTQQWDTLSVSYLEILELSWWGCADLWMVEEPVFTGTVFVSVKYLFDWHHECKCCLMNFPAGPQEQAGGSGLHTPHLKRQDKRWRERRGLTLNKTP